MAHQEDLHPSPWPPGRTRVFTPLSLDSRKEILPGSTVRLIKSISSSLLGLRIGHHLGKHWRIIKRNSSSLLILQAGYRSGKHCEAHQEDLLLPPRLQVGHPSRKQSTMKFMKMVSSPFLGLQVGHCEAHQRGCPPLLFELLKYLCIKTKPEDAFFFVKKKPLL